MTTRRRPLGADQAKHRERVRHGLDAGRTHPATSTRSCLRQGLGHQPQVRLRSNSDNHGLARHASLLNHAALGPLIQRWAVLAKDVSSACDKRPKVGPAATSCARHTYLTWIL